MLPKIAGQLDDSFKRFGIDRAVAYAANLGQPPQDFLGPQRELAMFESQGG
jgi:hypothetical protein